MQREESDLYGLPLDEFVAERTALERRLRKDGDRERASAVKKLPKPSVAAWAVNQASRSQPKARRELLDASAELRDTQERLIAGDASATELDKAARRQRAAIDALADAAAGLLSSDGKGLGDATLARVRETLAAVAADEEVAELFESGTFDRERRPAGLGFGGLAPDEDAARPKRAKASAKPKAAAKPAAGPKPSAKQKPSAKAREKAEKARKREVAAARERVKAAKAAEREAEKREKAAERDLRRAATALDRAERAAEEAREAAKKARLAAAGARDDLDRLS